MQSTSGDITSWDLSAAETAILTAVKDGKAADLNGERVRAEVIREIAFSRLGNIQASVFGLRIRNAKIVGQLNLDSCPFNNPLAFTRVEFVDVNNDIGLRLRDAYIKRLALHDVKIDGALVADRATFENGFLAERAKISGPVALGGARSGHAISFLDSSAGDGRFALSAAGMHADGSLVLRGSKFSGAVRLPRVKLGAGLDAVSTEIHLRSIKAGGDTGTETALDLESASVGGDLLLENAIIGASIAMENARIEGSIQATKCEVIANGGGWNMTGLNLDHSLSMEHARIKGVVRITGADIGKLLVANYITIDSGDTAIHADLIQIGGNFEMTNAQLFGQLRCPGADISGQMRLSESKIYGRELAIRGDGSQISGGCFFSRSSMIGLVRFPASQIGNQFRMRGATLKVETGPALMASGSHFARDVELNAGFEATGAVILDQTHIAGVCDLTGSRMRSAAIARFAKPKAEHRQMLRQDEIDNDQAVFSLVDARVGRLQLPILSDERPRGVVNLTRAHVGAYEDWASTWPPSFKQRTHDEKNQDIDHLVLDGFVYDHLVNPTGTGDVRHAYQRDRAGRIRAGWLDSQKRRDTKEYFRPQPWVQLAHRLAAQGLAGDARHIAILKRRRERGAYALTHITRWESRLLDWVALYGFNPWRTVLIGIAMLIIFTGVWSWASSRCEEVGCFDQRIFLMTNTDSYRAEKLSTLYPPFAPAGYAFDNLIPFLNFGYGDHWRPNVHYGPVATFDVPNIPLFVSGETDHKRIYVPLSITVGGFLSVIIIIQQLIGIVLISLIATGFAGVLRNDS